MALISEYQQDTFCMGTIGFLIPKNIGIDIKIVTLARSMLEPRAQVMANYVISMAASLELNVSLNEVEGREKMNPNIFLFI